MWSASKPENWQPRLKRLFAKDYDLFSAITFNIYLVAQRWLKMGIICLVISVILALIVALFYYNGLNKGFVLKLR